MAAWFIAFDVYRFMFTLLNSQTLLNIHPMVDHHYEYTHKTQIRQPDF